MVQAAPQPPRNGIEPYLAQFEERQSRAGAEPEWLAALRRSGITRFAELGFPTLEHEDWRFTNVAPIAKLPARPVLKPVDGLSLEVLKPLPLALMKCHRLVFIDGHYSAGLSSPLPQRPEVKAVGLSALLCQDGGTAREALSRFADLSENAFGALNSAFLTDGAFIHVPAGLTLEHPVHAIFLSTARENGASTHSRNVLLAERGSQVTFIESYYSLGEGAYFTNTVSQLWLGDGATVEHCKLQGEGDAAYHMATIQLQLGRASQCRSHSIALGARLSRNNIRAKLDGQGIDCILNGLYLTRGDQLADHHMVVEHAQPHCNSHEYFNGILAGHSKAVFHGRILVRPEAQKTDAKQTNKNLLLSDTATADAKPQLEIYADDVKCTHGATVGQLNEESIFYLRARGIGLATARRILIHAFAGEIIDRIQCEPVREELDRLVWDRLEQGAFLAEAP